MEGVKTLALWWQLDLQFCCVSKGKGYGEKESAHNMLIGNCCVTWDTRVGKFLLQWWWTYGFYKNKELFVHVNGIQSSPYNKTAPPLGHGLCVPCVTQRSAHISACQHKRAILEHQAHETGIPARQLYLPQCRDEDGSFESIQCHPVTRQCWCVDSAGDELPGTRASPNVQPSCAGRQSVASGLQMSVVSILVSWCSPLLFYLPRILKEAWLLSLVMIPTVNLKLHNLCTGFICN